MSKDLTSSRLDRQNILNNELAIEEIQKNLRLMEFYMKIKFMSRVKWWLIFFK